MTDKHSWRWVLAIITIAELAGGLEMTLTFAALPAAIRATNAPVEVGWLVTGHLLVGGAAVAVLSRLGDLFGKTYLLLASLAVAAAASMVSALSHDMTWIIVGRSIQGISAAILPLGYGLVREYLPSERVPLGVGVLTAGASASGAIGFILGGVIVDHFRWQEIFTASAVIAAFTLVVCSVLLPRSKASTKPVRLDLLGGLVFAPSIALLLLGVSNFNIVHTSARPFILALTGFAGLAFWVWHERGHAQPLFDLSLITLPEALAANIAGVFAAATGMQMLIILPMLLQQPRWTGIGFGLTATMTGILKVPLNVVSCFGGVAAGWLSSRWGSALVLLVGSVVSLAGFGLILVDLHGPLLYTVTAVGVNFVGGMFVYTAISNVIVDAVPCERTSEATGMNYVIRLIAQAAGAQVVIALLTDHVIATPGHRESSFPTSATYENLFGYLIGVSLLCVVTSAILVRMQCRYRYRRMPFRGI